MIQLFSAIFRYSDESATVTNNKHYDEDEKDLFLENCLATYSDDKAKFFSMDGWYVRTQLPTSQAHTLYFEKY